MRKELWFGFSLMAILIVGCVFMLVSAQTITNGHLGLLMLGLVVVAIMMGFPTAFTLMGMGMMFGWFAYRSVNPDLALNQILDLMVQRTYSVMSNDVLIAIPLFVFMGYLVERANLIEKLFQKFASGDGTRTRFAGGSDDCHVRDICDRDRDRRCGRDINGAAGFSCNAEGRLQRPGWCRRCYRGRVPGYFDSAFGAVDRLWRNSGRIGRPAVCRRVFSGNHAGHAVCRVCDRPGEDQAESDAAVVRRRPARRVALFRAALVAHAGSRSNCSGTRSKGSAKCRCAGTHVGFSTGITLLPALVIVLFMGLIFRSVTAPPVVQDTTGLQAMGFAGEAGGATDQASTGLAEPPPVEGSLQEPPSQATRLRARQRADERRGCR